MTIQPPPLHSVWENDNGKIFVLEVDCLGDDPDADDEDKDFFLVVALPYADRHNANAIVDELDPEQWAELIERDKIRMVGIEPI
ncbi:hypothetical protein ACNHE5_05610 [Pandoraea pnomenusa]|uniref:hypothetical protein n=1 Tax=Pandoraea pnomenusa TaxID=93220 RepID=UPI003CEABEF1